MFSFFSLKIKILWGFNLKNDYIYPFVTRYWRIPCIVTGFHAYSHHMFTFLDMNFQIGCFMELAMGRAQATLKMAPEALISILA